MTMFVPRIWIGVGIGFCRWVTFSAIQVIGIATVIKIKSFNCPEKNIQWQISRGNSSSSVLFNWVVLLKILSETGFSIRPLRKVINYTGNLGGIFMTSDLGTYWVNICFRVLLKLSRYWSEYSHWFILSPLIQINILGGRYSLKQM